MKSYGKGILFTICLLPISVSSMAVEKKEPKWMKKLTYQQKLIMQECPPQGRGGRYNYNATDPKTLKMKALVEGAHFTVGVRQLKYGNAATLGGDLNYVLNKFPNHLEALRLVVKLQAKDDFNPRRRNDRKDYLWPVADCYFKRAMAFAPKDSNVQVLYAVTKHKEKAYDVAERTYLKALQIAPQNAEAHYNLGLLYLAIGKQEQALEHAKNAYSAGYPLAGLKNKLKKEGIWPDS